MTVSSGDSTQRRVERWLFLLVFVSTAWFHNGANWNQISRLNMILAFVEPGTPDFLSFRIDRFITHPIEGINTGDWACNPRREIHYYSNKAPGLALAAIPVYAGIYLAGRGLSLDLSTEPATIVVAYLLNLAVTVLPLAFAVPLFVRILRRLGAPLGRAVFLGLALFPGSLLWPFGTQLWGHVTAAACLILALYFLVRVEAAWSLVWCGLWGGLAVLMDYSCAIAVVAMGVYLLCTCQRRQLPLFVLGGLLPLLIHALYHYSCFGSPLATGNLYNNPRFQEPDHLLGVFQGWRLRVWWGLTFSRDRGLFWFMPAMLLLLPALAFLRARRDHGIYWLSAAVLGAFFLMNATFNGWHGGGSTGPRYLIPALPFAVLLINLLPGWERWHRFAWPLLAVSAANMFVIAATCPMVPYLSKYYNPLPPLYRAVWNGWLHLFTVPPLRPDAGPPELVRRLATSNAGEWLGLNGTASLLPVLFFMAAALAVIWHLCQAPARLPATSAPLSMSDI